MFKHFALKLFLLLAVVFTSIVKEYDSAVLQKISRQRLREKAYV